MPVLRNARWERFAQERAKGKSANAAYCAAGYNEHPGNAHRLSVNESVVSRVAELQGRAAEKTVTTAADIARQLDEDRELARSLKQTAAAVAASMGKAKVLGLIVDKSEVGQPGDFERMSDDDLRDFVMREAAALDGAEGETRH